MSTNLRPYAQYYMRYWISRREVADNAPPELRRFVRASGVQTEMLHDAFALLANSVPAPMPDLPVVLDWASLFPAAAESHADEILRSRKPPQTLRELMERAYKSEVQVAVNQVRGLLNSQINENFP